MTLRAIVADDEALARRHLVRLLGAHCEIEIVAQASDGVEALTLIEALEPDVAFLDIQMPGLDAFDLLQRLKQQPLVVFTTAHDEHALAAFRENAVDYLLKPIASEELTRAVKKLLAHTTPPTFRTTIATSSFVPDPPSSQSAQILRQLLQRLNEPIDAPSQLLLTVRDTLRPLCFDQIVLLEASDKTTLVHTIDQTYESQSSLSELQAKLPRADFIRIHRRHIVNRRFIGALRRWGNRQLRVELTVPYADELLVSRRCYDDVLMWLGPAA